MKCERILPVLTNILLILKTFTSIQAKDSIPKCSDDALSQYFNCSSTDCTYGEETEVNCTIQAGYNCEVINSLIFVINSYC